MDYSIENQNTPGCRCWFLHLLLKSSSITWLQVHYCVPAGVYRHVTAKAERQFLKAGQAFLCGAGGIMYCMDVTMRGNDLTS